MYKRKPITNTLSTCNGDGGGKLGASTVCHPDKLTSPMTHQYGWGAWVRKGGKDDVACHIPYCPTAVWDGCEEG